MNLDFSKYSIAQKRAAIRNLYVEASEGNTLGSVNAFIKYLTEKNIKGLPQSLVQNTLLKFNVYFQTATSRKSKNLVRKDDDSSGIMVSAQADIMHLFDYRGWYLAIVVVDVNLQAILIECIKSRSKSDVKCGFARLFCKNKYLPIKLYMDKETSFVALNNWFKSFNVFPIYLQTQHACYLAENAIRKIRLKLVRFLRAKWSRNWVGAIDLIQTNLFLSKNRGLGNFSPYELNGESFTPNPICDIFISMAKKSTGNLNFTPMSKNVKAYSEYLKDKKSIDNLPKLFDICVMKNWGAKTMYSKMSDIKNFKAFKIIAMNYTRKPIMLQLQDIITNQKLPFKVPLSSVIVLGKNPKKTNELVVEKVFAQSRTLRNGTKETLVKFLGNLQTYFYLNIYIFI